MVNPYLQPRTYGGVPNATRSAPNQTKLGSLGSSQVLQKLENLGKKKKQSKRDKKQSSKQSKEFKSEKAKLFDSTSESETESSSATTDFSNSFVKKRASSSKFIKKSQPRVVESDERNSVDDEDEHTKSVESEMTIQSFKSDQNERDEEFEGAVERQALGTGRSSASRLHTASSSSIGRRAHNKVTFEKTLSKDDESQIVSMVQSQGSESEMSNHVNFSKNIYDIDQLQEIRPKRDKSNLKIQSSDDDESSYKNNFILDLHTLDIQNTKQSVTKKLTNLKISNEKWADEQRNSNRRSGISHKPRKTRTQSIVSAISEDKDTIVTEIQTEKSDSVDSIASEIKEDSATHRPHSRSSVASALYVDDFDTELETATNRSRVRTPMKFKRLENNLVEPEKKTIQVQVDEMDLAKSSPAFAQNLNVYSPFTLGPLLQLQNLDNIVQYNVINHTFNDIIKMNLDFMKNFLNVQRQLYENEIKSIKPKKYHF